MKESKRSPMRIGLSSEVGFWVLSAFGDNQPGQLAILAAIVDRHEVNTVSSSARAMGDHAYICCLFCGNTNHFEAFATEAKAELAASGLKHVTVERTRPPHFPQDMKAIAYRLRFVVNDYRGHFSLIAECIPQWNLRIIASEDERLVNQADPSRAVTVITHTVLVPVDFDRFAFIAALEDLADKCGILDVRFEPHLKDFFV